MVTLQNNMLKLSDDRDLYRMVDEVLHYIWDPIGISGAPRARDEYFGYVPRVFTLVRDGASASEIALHLRDLATESMGLSANPEQELKVAEILLEWKDIVRASPATLRMEQPPMPDYPE